MISLNIDAHGNASPGATKHKSRHLIECTARHSEGEPGHLEIRNTTPDTQIQLTTKIQMQRPRIPAQTFDIIGLAAQHTRTCTKKCSPDTQAPKIEA